MWNVLAITSSNSFLRRTSHPSRAPTCRTGPGRAALVLPEARWSWPSICTESTQTLIPHSPLQAGISRYKPSCSARGSLASDSGCRARAAAEAARRRGAEPLRQRALAVTTEFALLSAEGAPEHVAQLDSAGHLACSCGWRDERAAGAPRRQFRICHTTPSGRRFQLCRHAKRHGVHRPSALRSPSPPGVAEPFAFVHGSHPTCHTRDASFWHLRPRSTGRRQSLRRRGPARSR